MKIFKTFIFQIGDSCVKRELSIYEILNNLERTLFKKGTSISHIKKSS